MVRGSRRDFGAMLIAAIAVVVILIDVGARREVAKQTAAIRMLAATVAAGERSSALILIFQLEDCGSMRPVTLSLSQQSIVPVIGAVVDGAEPADSAFLARKFGIYFPVRRVEGRAAASLARNLGYTSTPFLLAVTTDGRILAARPALSIADVMKLAKWADSS